MRTGERPSSARSAVRAPSRSPSRISQQAPWVQRFGQRVSSRHEPAGSPPSARSPMQPRSCAARPGRSLPSRASSPAFRRRLFRRPPRARICVPSERIVVTTAGRPVGIAETANAIAAVKTVLKVSPRERLRIIESATAAPAMNRIWFVSFASWRVSGVSVSSSDWRGFEMWPTSVAIPVAVTTNWPVPRVVFVFMKTMSVRSPRWTSSAADGVDALRYRHALARQRRLGHLERRGGKQPPGRGDDVARDELLGRKLEELAAATYLRLDDHHLLQCRDGGCRLAFLVEAEDGVEHREQEQHDPRAVLGERHDALDPRDEQHDLHRVVVLPLERAPARLTLGFRKLVRPVLLEARRGFL